MKCPKCGGKTTKKLRLKDGSSEPALCKECLVKENLQTHEIIARVCLRKE